MTTTLRAAIIGTGRIGSTYDDEVTDRRDPAFFQGADRHVGLYTVLPVNHAGGYRTTPGYDLIAAANRGAEKLHAFGERWGVRALYTDYRALLRDERPDVVSVCTQSPEKAEIVVAAAEAGVRAIIVEKAFATSMAEADAMQTACARHDVLLVVNHPYRFSPLARAARARIEDGSIGTLGTVSAFAVGGMLHVGTHTFDLLRFWAGDVIEVAAWVPDYTPGQDLPATGVIRFASGVEGFFDHRHRVQPGYEARGTAGRVAISALVGDGWFARTEPFGATGARPYPQRMHIAPIEGAPHTMSPTQRLLDELHATLTTGAPFISTGPDGAAALEIGLACFQSHLAGGPVRLPLRDRAFRVPNR
jgi:predicted dehydrogenase